jgi:hypothetical protein
VNPTAPVNLLTSGPAPAWDKVQQGLATSRIAISRLKKDGTSDEAIFATVGLTPAEYWRREMAEPVKALSLAALLAVHLEGPGDTQALRDLVTALCVAREAGVRWFVEPEHGPGDSAVDWLNILARAHAANKGAPDVDHLLPPELQDREPTGEWAAELRRLFPDAVIGDDPLPGADSLGGLMVHPRPATEWLASIPSFRDLVPAGLRALLEADKQMMAPDAGKTRAKPKRRRPSATRPRTPARVAQPVLEKWMAEVFLKGNESAGGRDAFAAAKLEFGDSMVTYRAAWACYRKLRPDSKSGPR